MTRGKSALIAIVSVVLTFAGVAIMIDRSGLLKEGDEAPDFTARLSTGEEITLSQFRGKKNVVLSFYPADFTAGCTNQACSYRDSYGSVASLDAVIIGISTDGDARHREFSQSYQLPFPLISDPERNIIRLYGANRPGGALLPTKRVTYVIDKDGVIRLVAHHEFLIRKHIEEIIGVLQVLQEPLKNV